jgi:hypothetical protein
MIENIDRICAAAKAAGVTLVTHQCLDCYWSYDYTAGGTTRIHKCPRCRSIHVHSLLAERAEWDPAIMRFVNHYPDEPCETAQSGRLCSVGDCSICQWGPRSEQVPIRQDLEEAIPL